MNESLTLSATEETAGAPATKSAFAFWVDELVGIESEDFANASAMRTFVEDCPQYFHAEGRNLRGELITELGVHLVEKIAITDEATNLGTFVPKMKAFVELSSLYSAEKLLVAMAFVKGLYAKPEAKKHCPYGLPVVIASAINAGARHHYDEGSITPKLLARNGYERTFRGNLLVMVHPIAGEFTFGKVAGIGRGKGAVSPEEAVSRGLARKAERARKAMGPKKYGLPPPPKVRAQKKEESKNKKRGK